MPEFDKDGNMVLNERYIEILKLKVMLDDAKIPYEIRRSYDGWQIHYPSKDSRVVSVIEHLGSYGCDGDLLEIMGLLYPEEEKYDSVAGHLTAYNVYNRIIHHYWMQSYPKANCVCLKALHEKFPYGLSMVRFEHVDASGYWFTYRLLDNDMPQGYVVRHHEVAGGGGSDGK